MTPEKLEKVKVLIEEVLALLKEEPGEDLNIFVSENMSGKDKFGGG